MSNYYRSLIQSLTVSGLINDLVAYYSFDASNANDIHGGHNGTTAGSPTYSSGKNGNCIDFGGDNVARYFRVNDNNDFSFTNGGGVDLPFTVSMWVNFSAISPGGHWFVNKRTAILGGDEWQMMYYLGKIIFTKMDGYTGNVYQGVGFDFAPTLGIWYHICCTDNGSKTLAGMKIYLNGVSQTLVSFSKGTYFGMINGSSQTAFGAMNWNLGDPGFKHKGKMDEVAIWKNRELNTLEVNELYNSGTGKFYNTF